MRFADRSLKLAARQAPGNSRSQAASEGPMKESFQRAFAYLQSQKIKMSIGQQMDTTDFHVEAINLLTNHVSCEAGIAAVVAFSQPSRTNRCSPG